MSSNRSKSHYFTSHHYYLWIVQFLNWSLKKLGSRLPTRLYLAIQILCQLFLFVSKHLKFLLSLIELVGMPHVGGKCSLDHGYEAQTNKHSQSACLHGHLSPAIRNMKLQSELDGLDDPITCTIRPFIRLVGLITRGHLLTPTPNGSVGWSNYLIASADRVDLLCAYWLLIGLDLQVKA